MSRRRRLGLPADLGDGEPVVFVRLFGDPRRQRHAQVVAQRGCIALIKRTQVAQAVVRLAIAADADTALA